MGLSIGIDLGYNNCRTAINDGKDIRILQNREGEYSTRSCVSWNKNKKGNTQTLVGGTAFDRIETVPKDTIISIKRLIGRVYSDPEVQKVKEDCSYDVVSTSDGTDEDIRVVM